METSADYPEGGQLFAELIPHIIWIARADGAIVYFNRRTMDYTGLPAEQLLDWGWLKLIHPADALLARETSKKAAQGAGPYETEFRIRKGDGNYYWHLIRAFAERDAEGRTKKVVGTWTEIEEYKTAKRGMQELVAIVESSDDAIIGKTLDGIVTSWNRGAERLLGYGAEEVIGQPITRFIPADRLDEETQILARL